MIDNSFTIDYYTFTREVEKYLRRQYRIIDHLHYISPLILWFILIVLNPFISQVCHCDELPVNLLNPPAICNTVKKGLRHSRPQPGCHLPNSPSAGIIKLFSPPPSLVSDIPAGDGNVASLFLRCTIAETSRQTHHL